jgi:hypothetical protein
MILRFYPWACRNIYLMVHDNRLGEVAGLRCRALEKILETV